MDNRIGLSSGADLRLTVCCRPGRCVRRDTALYRPGFVNDQMRSTRENEVSLMICEYLEA